MKRIVLASAFVSALAAAQPPERPNVPVFRSGPWFVVRSVQGGGSVACTGFYRANRHVQLSKDTLIIQTPEEARSVAVAFDDERMPSQRPLSAGEKDLKAIALTGEDFGKLAKSRKLHIEAATSQGVVRHDLELTGLAGALENIDKGCPLPQPPKRQRHRS